MTKCERPVSDIIREVVERTGIDKSTLKVPILRKLKPDLVDIWRLSKQHLDASIFIKAWNNFKELNEFKDISSTTEIKNKKITKKDIDENLKIVEQKMVHQEGLYAGFITTGFYRGKEYKYFTKSKEIGKDKLKDFILSEIFKNKSEDNKWFDKFYAQTMTEGEV